MNENTPDTRFDLQEPQPQRREKRRAMGGSKWLGGILLILLGLLMLAQNLKIAVFQNWWALFILFPAFGSFGAARRIYQVDGRMTVRGRGMVLVGLLFFLVASMFLLNLNWTLLGPGLLILAGFGLLVNALFPD